MKWIDRAATFMLFALGCIHNFIAAPASFETVSTDFFWFVTGGITLWYASFINFLWLTDKSNLKVRVVAFLTNAILLTFTISFVAIKESWTDPQNALLVGPAAWLTLTTAAQRRN